MCWGGSYVRNVGEGGAGVHACVCALVSPSPAAPHPPPRHATPRPHAMARGPSTHLTWRRSAGMSRPSALNIAPWRSETASTARARACVCICARVCVCMRSHRAFQWGKPPPRVARGYSAAVRPHPEDQTRHSMLVSTELHACTQTTQHTRAPLPPCACSMSAAQPPTLPKPCSTKDLPAILPACVCVCA